MALLMPNSATNSPFYPIEHGSLASKRSSVSTTKSALRASNATLIDMLQNIQVELFSHRSIMLDIQSRVTQLEQRPTSMTTYTEIDNVEHQTGTTHDVKSPANPEGSEWWKACQNFARNSNPPLSAGDFLRTPQPSSAFGPETPPSTPPSNKVIEVHVDEVSVEQGELTPKAKLVEVEVKELPPPPVLQPVPAVKQTVKKQEEEEDLSGPPLRSSTDISLAAKRARSRATYQARFKHSRTDKGASQPVFFLFLIYLTTTIEHVILIKFHHVSDL